MITPRATIEINGVRAEFDLSLPGSYLGDCWRCSDPLLQAEIRKVARPIGGLHRDVTIDATIHVIMVAREMGARIIEMVGCAELPDNLPPTWKGPVLWPEAKE